MAVEDLAAIEAVSLLRSEDRLCSECHENVAEYSTWTPIKLVHCKYCKEPGAQYAYDPATRLEERICGVVRRWLYHASGAEAMAAPSGREGQAVHHQHVGAELPEDSAEPLYEEPGVPGVFEKGK